MEVQGYCMWDIQSISVTRTLLQVVRNIGEQHNLIQLNSTIFKFSNKFNRVLLFHSLGYRVSCICNSDFVWNTEWEKIFEMIKNTGGEGRNFQIEKEVRLEVSGLNLNVQTMLSKTALYLIPYNLVDNRQFLLWRNFLTRIKIDQFLVQQTASTICQR